MSQASPHVGHVPWELRFTRRALADLGVDPARDTPGDLTAVRRTATYPRPIDDFAQKRQDDPAAPGAPLHSVGPTDIISLHSAAGGRAATWHDPDNAVVWFVGFTPEHDYNLFEQRAAAGDLLPDEEDELLLELEREQLDFRTRVCPGLEELVERAIFQPGVPQRGMVGRLLQLELSATVLSSGDDAVGDVWIVVHLPPPAGANDVPGWPGPDLLKALATMLGADELDYSTEIPDVHGWRPLDPSAEMAIVARNVLLGPEAASRPPTDL